MSISPATLRLRTALFWALPVLACALPLATNPYTQFVLNSMLISTLLTLGFNMVIGSLGQLAFANVAFFGLGAYASVIAMNALGLPWLATIPLSGLVGAAGGFLASAVALRGIRLYYLAIVTLAFGELLRWLYIHADGLTGGTDGLALPRETFLGFRLGDDTAQFYVFLAVTVVLVKGTLNLLRSRLGRSIIAVRENEIATASLGIPTARVIVTAFMWSGFLVGVAGALFAAHIGRVFPESFGLTQLIVGFAMVLVGGTGSVLGSVLGAVLLTALPEYVRAFPGMEEIFFGLVVIVVLLCLPQGLASLLRRLSPVFLERHFRE
ncbi:branched-chain amino acid ABC transporter permease (plasmid) [Paroceanicella profunda]|uniref:Branched-chain amino acid ABC transporter permease n=1 Tax=Paroceanicella profunda TaxID=2579971 RepID=A0A5B8G2E4_9RHOB|nr:branched-chain amino acid ABC transporter permease [Paroceanicella profunda]QDL94070.1 branched-chain amino acid ABC transporter permease [Paroceanicella profunda]